MRILVLVVVVLAYITPIAYAQNWVWAETAGGTLPDEANGCHMDAAGNMYMSGFYFSGDINFGNGNELSNDGLSDGFTVKYNPSGTALWASKIKGSAEDKSTKCVADASGNVFTTGYFNSSSIQFGGNNSDNVSNSNGSGFDAFIVKYNSVGTPLWYHAIGNDDDDGGASVAVDAQGNSYVTGWWRASSMTVGGTVLTNYGDSDMFLIKYDPNGNVLWAKNAGGIDDDKGRGVAVDVDGNIIVTGYFKADMTVSNTVYVNNGSKDFFVIKYSPNGTILAAKTYGGTGSEEAFSCSTDDAGNVFIAGNYSSTSVTFDAVSITNPGSNSGAFLLKLDPSLTAIWARGFSSDDKDEALGCSSDSYGNSVVTGTFSGNSLSIGGNVLNNNGGDEIFIAKYDPNGNLFWAKKIGKSNDDGSNDCSIIDDGSVIIAGYYNSGSLTLGNFDLDNSYFIVATSDVFIGRMCLALSSTQSVTACNQYTWIDGNTYTTSTNSAAFSFPNGGSACDSIVTLDLTLNTVDVNVTEVTPNLMANANAVDYRWLDCDANYAFLPGETDQTFTAATDGNYAVEITDNACIDTSDCYWIDVLQVGMLDQSAGHVLNVYPNPVTKGESVFLSSIQGKIRIIQLTSSTGQIVLNSSESSFSTADINSGLYFYHVISEHGKTVTGKIMIQ